MIKNIIRNLRGFDKFYRLNNINLVVNQNGGGKLYFKYKGKIIKFKRYIDEDKNIEIYLKTIDNKNNCIVITICNDEGIGYINTINSSFGDCLNDIGLNNNGITYIKISIELLKKYKDEFRINKIQLSDDAIFYCNKNIKLSMSKLNFLQHGESYYGRFGFIPVEDINKEQYKLNKDIIKKIKTKRLDLVKVLRDYNKKINNELFIKLNHKYIKYREEKFYRWFNRISRILVYEDCNLLAYLLDKIFIEFKLYPIDNIFYELRI